MVPISLDVGSWDISISADLTIMSRRRVYKATIITITIIRIRITITITRIRKRIRIRIRILMVGSISTEDMNPY